MPPLFPAPSRLRRAPALHALALAAACALPGAALAQQQDAALPALRLKASPMLDERLPASGTALPTFVRGERIIGGSNTETVVEGDAELRKAGMTLRSARLQHDARSDIASTDNPVHMNHAGNRYQGSSARMQVDAHEAVVHDPSYRLRANGAHGTAQRLDFAGADRVTIWGGTYTTCQCEDKNGKPDWVLRSRKLELDHEEGVGRAKGAVLEFKSFPLLPLPSMSFPLNSERRSGLLAPTIGLDNKSGLSFLQPYYFNIAPNRDATLWPHLMLRRGLDLGGQFRYLEQDYRGRINAHYMANDRLRDGRNRWGVFARHDATLHTGIGPVNAYLNLNRVSDDDHWRDFSSRGEAFNTSRLLANEGALSWRRGNFSFSALASKWQTLQSVGDSVITPPYDRLPQVTARYARADHRGFDYSAEAGFTRFRGERSLTRQPDADRAHAVVRVTRPIERSWGFLTPMAQVHSTHYSFHGAGADASAAPQNRQRTVPIFSLDSGLIFERTTSFRGHTLLQTLEPRLKYVYSPYRE
ncbi:MAG: LPS-assembly protein LptD, partial [Ottowia sp.]|nr:LPS-assembly protein LptD [Ottowia sp.]